MLVLCFLTGTLYKFQRVFAKGSSQETGANEVLPLTDNQALSIIENKKEIIE
jgi:hypothetical protein